MEENIEEKSSFLFFDFMLTFTPRCFIIRVVTCKIKHEIKRRKAYDKIYTYFNR